MDGVSLDIGARRDCWAWSAKRAVARPPLRGRILMLVRQTLGHRPSLDDQEIAELRPDQLHAHRRKTEIIFQDPYGALNPRITVGAIV